MNFRKVLLNRCQKEFEKDKDDDEIIERKRKDLESASEVPPPRKGETFSAVSRRLSELTAPFLRTRSSG